MLKNRFIIVSRVIGMLLILEASFMLLSVGVALYYGESAYQTLLLCAVITLATGLFLRIPFLNHNDIDIGRKEGFLIVALIWIIMSLFGALPYYIGGYLGTYTDAFFETMSGFTTTGSSVITDVELIPKSVLFWRALTHFIGGIGIVVIVLSFIPFIAGGGMSLFSAEVAGPTKDKLSPHITTTAKILVTIYVSLNVACIIALCCAGMKLFDATCFSFAALASGGFTTTNNSCYTLTPAMQYILIVAMIFSGTNFTLIYYAIKGKWRNIKKSEELKVYLAIIIIATLLICVFIYNSNVGLERTVRNALFQATSMLSSTGFVNTDYNYWAQPAIFVLFLLMLCEAMSGSTSGGVKIVRMIVLFKNAKRIIKQSIHANAYMPVRFEGEVVSDKTMNNIFTMFLLYFVSSIVALIIFAALGVNLYDSLGAIFSTIGNIGAGFGASGGFGGYASFPQGAKWVMSALMYVGRLELLTVFVLFMPSFWKN